MTEKQLVGIDVSAKTLAVSVDIHSGPLQRLEFANTRAGHQQLIRRLNKQRRRDARACLEWTGVYSLDLALALHRAPRIEVTVVNPRSVRDFAKAWLRRSKTDMLDADLLVEFVRRMPFRRWEPPTQAVFDLRAIARRIGALTHAGTQESNRSHAASHCQELTDVVKNDIQVHRRFLKRRIQQLQEQAVNIIWEDLELRKALGHLTSIKGIAKASAIQILAELAVLPQGMTPRQFSSPRPSPPSPAGCGTAAIAMAEVR